MSNSADTANSPAGQGGTNKKMPKLYTDWCSKEHWLEFFARKDKGEFDIPAAMKARAKEPSRYVNIPLANGEPSEFYICGNNLAYGKETADELNKTLHFCETF